MLDADISEQTIKFNDALDTRLDESKFLIPRMGDFNLEDDGFQTPKWYLAYRDNTLTDEEYVSMENEDSLP